MAKRNKKRDGSHVATIEYLDVYQLADQAQRNWDDPKTVGQFRDFNGYSVDARMTEEEALKLAHQGGYWPEGAQHVQPVTIDASHIVKDELAMPRHMPTVAGGSPNVPAYLTGNPVNMRRLHFPKQPNRLLRLFVDVGMVWHTTSDAAFNRGNAILSVVDALTAGGFSVEVTAAWNTRDFNDYGGMCVKTVVKRSNMSWSPDSIAFCFSNDAFTRRLLWTECARLAAHGTDEEKEIARNLADTGLGNGHHGTYASSYEGYQLHIGHLMGDQGYETPAKALKTVMAEITKQLEALA